MAAAGSHFQPWLAANAASPSDPLTTPPRLVIIEVYQQQQPPPSLGGVAANYEGAHSSLNAALPLALRCGDGLHTILAILHPACLAQLPPDTLNRLASFRTEPLLYLVAHRTQWRTAGRLRDGWLQIHACEVASAAGVVVHPADWEPMPTTQPGSLLAQLRGLTGQSGAAAALVEANEAANRADVASLVLFERVEYPEWGTLPLGGDGPFVAPGIPAHRWAGPWVENRWARSRWQRGEWWGQEELDSGAMLVPTGCLPIGGGDWEVGVRGVASEVNGLAGAAAFGCSLPSDDEYDSMDE